MEISHQYQPDDEIDLFELFSSLCQQWRILVGITLVGIVLSVTVALLMPKQYVVEALVALPEEAQAIVLTNKGYIEHMHLNGTNLRVPYGLPLFPNIMIKRHTECSACHSLCITVPE